MADLTEVHVHKIPQCQMTPCTREAEYDAALLRMKGKPWAYVCQIHFTWWGCKLGTGVGQKLVLREKVVS